MSDFAISRLDEIARRDSWIPLRDHFGILGFGVNAYRSDEVGGVVISEHTESMAKHEELYVVVEGHATFTVDGDEVDAPTGTLVFVQEPATRRGAVAKVAGTTVLVAGARSGHAFEVAPWEDAWRENQDAMKLYREERYDEAAAVLRTAIAQRPEAAGLVYNLACMESLGGADAASVAHDLARAIDLHPPFVDLAREDADLDRVRDDPAIATLLAERDEA